MQGSCVRTIQSVRTIHSVRTIQSNGGYQLQTLCAHMLLDTSLKWLSEIPHEHLSELFNQCGKLAMNAWWVSQLCHELFLMVDMYVCLG